MAFYFFDPGRPIPPPSVIGSKAFNLCRMRRAGLQVPPFFVITAEALAMPEAIDQKELYAAYDQITGGEGLVSVRSSASIEDGASFSFAGQFYTGLFTDKNKLLPEIQKCRESASGPNIGEYMRLNHIKTGTFPFAIVVQKMVHATRSGIGFSMRPGGNLANMCIVAGYGAGEGVVLGKVETDTYFLNRKNRELQKIILPKTEQFGYSGHAGIMPVEEKIINQAALSDEEIQRIGDLLIQTERLLGTPSDIEFCMDENADLFLIQMRPITGIQSQQIKILDNTNIVESYPGISLPLTFDFARDAYAKLFRSSARAFWVPEAEMAGLEEVFENLIAHVKGRIYYRLDNWYRMLARVHRSKRSMREWEDAVGLRDSEMDHILPGFKGKISTYISSVWLILNLRSGNRKYYRYFDRYYQKLRSYDRFVHDPARLWQHYETSTNSLFSIWHQTILNDFIAFQSFAWVQALLKKAGISEIANDLVSVKSGVDSEEAIIEIMKLSEWIRHDKSLRALFEEEDFRVLEVLREGSFPEFSIRFFAYLEQYGDRTLAELKLETQSPRRFPHILVQILRQQINAGTQAGDFLLKKQALLEDANKKKKAKFPWWYPNRWVLEFCLSLARYGLKNRENMRFNRTRAYGAVKDIFLEIGALMVRQQMIREENDIFYLDLEEIKTFCIRGNCEAFGEKIETRKKSFQESENLQLPDRIMYIDVLPEFALAAIEQNPGINELIGIGVSPGSVRSDALVCLEPAFDMDVSGRILVSKMTDPGWVFLMAQAAALVSEKGSLLSHTAIVGRELGIPVVVNVPGATKRIQTGDHIYVDGTRGTVTIEKKLNTFSNL